MFLPIGRNIAQGTARKLPYEFTVWLLARLFWSAYLCGAKALLREIGTLRLDQIRCFSRDLVDHFFDQGFKISGFGIKLIG